MTDSKTKNIVITILLVVVPSILAVYLIYRLFVTDQFEKPDYAAMVILHGTLLIRTLIYGRGKKNKL